MRTDSSLRIAMFLLVPALCSVASAGRADRPDRRPAVVTPRSAYEIIMGRPTATTVVLNVLCEADTRATIAYGTKKDDLSAQTSPVQLRKSEAQEVTLDGLKPDATYWYELRVDGKAAASGTFHTQRAPGASFVFEVQGDSHPERPQMFDSSLYAQTLRAAAVDRPDFYILLGDDFSVDTLRTISADTVRQVYLTQRSFLNLVGSPAFLVNGNHEQAAMANLDGTPTSVAVLAQNARNSLFPQPAPDGFYTGNATKVEHIGLLRNYYAWTWGDALFVVIDPYWHSKQPVDNVFGKRDKPARDLWDVTLGDEQYQWLKKTLQESKARFKFVFAHHVLGTGRGGVERAGLFEWGGKGNNGVDEFARRRPGWEMPIHALMAKTGVTIFFQGHDHIFAKQELDGVIYQTLPTPADPNYALMNRDAYRSGVVLPGSGRARVSVLPGKVRVEYVRSYLPKDATPAHPDQEVAFAYEVGSTGATRPTTVATTAPTAANVVLGRPTASSITASVLFYADARAYIAYGSSADALTTRTEPHTFRSGEPFEVLISSLKPDTQYHYELRDPATDRPLVAGRFHTQRPPGSAFTFTIQADSHLDDQTEPALYRQTLANAAADRPDFVIDLGDTFMTDKHATRDDAAKQYAAQRQYLASIGAIAPVFLVLGNHDGESRRDHDGTANGLAVWANTMRKRYFANPIPDTFYTGDDAKDPFAGLLQDYYAWTWGDALFVVLNPYWHSARPRGRDDFWAHSLGAQQYKWLAQTLAGSKAKHKFIFIHNLIGNTDNQQRGGATAAHFGEWGGKNADGSDGFAAHRPNWNLPIHDLLARHKVTTVFHGHDHFYAREQRDGVAYILVPQPGHPGPDQPKTAEAYGYPKDADLFGGPGHVRVIVTPQGVKTEYVRSAIEPSARGRKNGEVVRRWESSTLQ